MKQKFLFTISASSCPPTFTKVMAGTISLGCYYYSSIASNWCEAQLHCQDLKAGLANPDLATTNALSDISIQMASSKI